jgi:sodium/proline symporter
VASQNPVIIVTFIIYLLFMMGVGAFFYRRTNNISDYILGGRKVNYWVTSLSAQASDMSGWLLMGLPGFAYLAGLEAVWIALGLAVGTWVNWKYVARRLRIYTELAGDAITLPDYFENRFRDKTKVLRIVSSIFILVFFLIYTSSGFVAGAKLFSSVFGLPYQTGLMVGVLVIIGYTFLGGYMAVSWTDFFQGILWFIAVTLGPIS